MYCPRCGKRLSEYARFCSECGFAFDMNSDVNLSENYLTDSENANIYNNDFSKKAESVLNEDSDANSVMMNPELMPENMINSESFSIGSNANVDSVKKASAKKQTAGQIVLSSIICIFIFVFLFSALSVLTLRNCFDSERLKAIPHSVNTEKLEQTLEEYGVEKGDVEELLDAYEEMGIKEFVDDKIETFSDFVLEDGDFGEFDTDEVISVIMEDSEYFLKETGYELNEEDIREYLDGEGEEIIHNISTGGNAVGDAIATLRVIFSRRLIIVFVLIILVLALLLVVIQRFNLRSVLWLGVNVFITSLLFVFVYGILVGGIISSALIDYPQVLMVVKTLFGSVLGYIYTLGITLMLISAVAIVAYIIVRKVMSRKSKSDVRI